MCQQKHTYGASLCGKKACLDCLFTKNRPEVGLERAGRFIHHIPWEYREHTGIRSRHRFRMDPATVGPNNNRFDRIIPLVQEKTNMGSGKNHQAGFLIVLDIKVSRKILQLFE